MPVFPLFFMLVCLTVILFVMVPMMRRRDRQKTELDILDKRFARGEINPEEYLEKKWHILG